MHQNQGRVEVLREQGVEMHLDPAIVELYVQILGLLTFPKPIQSLLQPAEWICKK
jgi:hypothetical protein